MVETPNWEIILGKLHSKQDLLKAEAVWAMQEMMSGEADSDVVASFLVALRAKGESPAEISGLVDVMLANSVKVPVSDDAVDIVGTGGDQLGTVNISTMAAIVTAACGVPVLKHGSRSASGKTGSSEFLEALGIKLDLAPERLAEIFAKLGITFFFAPLFHPALKHVAPIRKQLGVPTTFNFLGPLANPVQPLATALGVANAAIMGIICEQMAQRDRTAIIFRGNDGLDELTITGNSSVILVKNGQTESLEFDPNLIGITRADISALIGGDAAENAGIARQLFSGKLGDSHPIFQIVALNAAVAMAAYQLAQSEDLADFNFLETMKTKYLEASNAISQGSAAEKLQAWVEESNK